MTINQLLLKDKKKLTLYGVGVLLASLTNIIFTFGMSYAFNVLDATTIEQVIPILIISILIMITPAIVQLISRMIRIGFMADTVKEVRLLAYRKIMSQDIESFSKEEKESYQASLISDINLFEDDFFLSVLNIGYVFFSFLFSFIILIQYSWTIAFIALTTSLIQYLISKIYEKRVRASRKKSQDQNKTYNTILSNLISGFKSIKSYASTHLFEQRFKDEVISLEEVKAQYFAYSKNQELLSRGVSTISNIIIFFIAALLMSQDSIKISDFIIILNLSSSLVWGMISGTAFVNRLKASIDIYYRIVKSDSQVSNSSNHNLNDVYLQVKDLNFSYGDNHIIKNLSFNLEKNEKLLIHGPSGTGKTTLLNCLAQNLSGYQGTIHYNDIELSDIHHSEFLNLTSYIRQAHFMFDDSIKNNIILDLEYNEDKFIKVLKQASIYDWVSEVGSDYLISANGSNISGGQRQRISIARELYSDYEIIFIDEPSASLDDENSKTIYETILNLDKTVICVSHRHLDILKNQFDHVISFEGDNL